MKIKRPMLLIIITICFFMTVSCICAEDNLNETFADTSDEFSPETHNINSLYGINDSGTFDELDSDIQNLNPGDIYELNRDYCFSKKAEALLMIM